MRHWLVVTGLLAGAACATLPMGRVSISQGTQPGTVQINRIVPTANATPLPEPVASVLDRLTTANPQPANVPDSPAPSPGASAGPTATPFPIGGGGGGGGGSAPASPDPAPSASVSPSPAPSPTPTPLPGPQLTPTPPPQIGPIPTGTWRIAVTLHDGTLDYVYYRLACQADGSVEVNFGAIPQDYAGDYSSGQPGWNVSTVHFTNGCEDLADGTWCVYYELAADSPTTLTGQTVIVGPDDQEFRFPATGYYIGP